MSILKVITSLTLALGAMAIPATLQPRTCTNFYAPDLNRITQHQPEAGSAPVKTPFYVWNEIGKNDLIVSFRYVPENVVGPCTLQFDYHPGKNPIVVKDIDNPTQFNVYTISDGGNFPYNPTWENSAARTGPLVATWQFPSNLKKRQVVTINSFTCQSIMDFRISVADDNARGGVQIDEDTMSGLRLTYNC
jgi:hypothetical protein